jgi:NAD(P)-dependent dehydrogenase (short-subunit alcohol dehydrogenase family)
MAEASSTAKPSSTAEPRDTVAAITGASRGIGAAIALELARRGRTVACLTRAGRGIEAPPAPPELLPRLIALRCDVTDEASVRAAFAELQRRGLRLTALINNAGLHLQGRSEVFSSADFAAVLATNATAAFTVCREAFPHLKAAGGGTIVNLGSFFDRLGVPRNAAYAASKAAVAALTRCLAVEWAPQRIRVLNVAPGYVETDLNRDFLQRDGVRDYLTQRIPVGRPGTPEEVARLVAALLAEEIPSLTGATVYMDGGQSIAH